MIDQLEIRSDPSEAGMRLDAWLAKKISTSSRALCRESVQKGRVSVNGAVCRNKGAKLCGGETIAVRRFPELTDIRVRPDSSIPFRILFEDEHLVAVDKPAGIPVQPLSHDETGTLMNGLVAKFPELAGIGDQPLMAGALHRIDTETSGLVLAARTPHAFDAVRSQFKDRSFVKTYYALVEGHVAIPGRLHHFLAHDPDSRCCRMVDAASLKNPDLRMEAETVYVPERWIGRWSLLRVTIKTGVTHQIRCQLSLAGHPIVGDALYGGTPRLDTPRHFLHAFAVEFTHPKNKLPCRIEAPLNPDFLELITD